MSAFARVLQPEPRRLAPLLAGGALLLVFALPKAPVLLPLLFAALGLPVLAAWGGSWGAGELLAGSLAAGWGLLCAVGGATALTGHLEWTVPFALAATLLLDGALSSGRTRPLRIRLDRESALDLLVAAAAFAVSRALVDGTGPQPDGDFFVRGWLGRDTTFLFGIAEEAALRHGWPTENPVMAGTPLHYAALGSVALGGLALHCGATAISLGWLNLLPLLAATPVLLRRLVVRHVGRRTWGALPQLALLALVALRPDLVLLLQAQSLSFGVLLLVLRATTRPRVPTANTALLGLALLVCVGANAVLGLAAMAAVGLWAAEGLRRGRPLAPRWPALVALHLGVALHVALQRVAVPPEARPLTVEGLIEALPTEAATWLLAAAMVALVGATLLGRRSRAEELLAALVPLGLFAATLGMQARLADSSDRWFIAFNAPRLLHIGALLPVVLTRRRRRLAPAVPGLALLLLAVALSANDPDSLLRATAAFRTSPTTAVGTPRMRLLAQMRRELPIGARVMTAPGDLFVPTFSGHPQSPAGEDIWAPHDVTPQQFLVMWQLAQGFPELPPDFALTYFDRIGFTHWLFQGDGPNREWLPKLLATFPPGSWRVRMEEYGWVLLERLR